MNRSLTAGIAIVATALAWGCGGSVEQEQAAEAAAEAAKDGAAQMAEGAEAMAKGLEALTKGAVAAGKVDVVDFEVLGAAFPEVSGWSRDEVTGTTSSLPMPMSQAEVSYRKDGARIKMTVVDTALNQMLFAPFAMYMASNFSERSSDGYKKGTTVKGEPGFEDVNTRTGSADLTVVVGKRFIVTAEGSGGASIEDVRAAVELLDFGTLTAAK